jgi:3-hydroxyisobutyrate dehydrogenase
MIVGFVGLGHMGGPMAANLVAAGHQVRGCDLVEAAREAAAAAGVTVVADAAEAATGADIVITMLPGGRHVLDCYRDGLLQAAGAGTLVVDCSTIDVYDARSAHGLAAAQGLRSLDAPVSGGVVGAEAGTLTFMVGGAAADVERVQPLLDVMGRRTVHCGEAGAGQAAKICNNMILGISMVAVSEAFVLGERLGLTHQALFDVAANASGQCWALTTNCPVPGPVPASPANRDYQPGFAVDLMLKDLRLARDAAQASTTETELGAHAAEIYERLAEAGAGGEDFSTVYRAIRAASQEQAA